MGLERKQTHLKAALKRFCRAHLSLQNRESSDISTEYLLLKEIKKPFTVLQNRKDSLYPNWGITYFCRIRMDNLLLRNKEESLSSGEHGKFFYSLHEESLASIVKGGISFLSRTGESLSSAGQGWISYFCWAVRHLLLPWDGGQDFSYFCRTGINILLMFDGEIPLTSGAKLGCFHIVRPERSCLPFKGGKRCSLLQNRENDRKQFLLKFKRDKSNVQFGRGRRILLLQQTEKAWTCIGPGRFLLLITGANLSLF
jgi:hypothetical protein